MNQFLTDEERRALVEAACEAAEIFTEDELEAYAEELKEKQSKKEQTNG